MNDKQKGWTLDASVALCVFGKRDEPITRDVDTGERDEKGRPIKTKETMTLGKAIVASMIATLPGDETASGDRKFRLYQVAQRFDAGGEVEVHTKDIELIKERVGKLYGAVVVGAVFELLPA